MFICEKCHGVGYHEPWCPDRAPAAPMSDPTVTPTPTEPVTATFGHGCITLTWYPSSQRVGVVQRGQNAVMDEWEFVEFARQMTALTPLPAVSAAAPDEQAVATVARAVLATPADWPGPDREQEWAEHIARAALAAAHAETEQWKQRLGYEVEQATQERQRQWHRADRAEAALAALREPAEALLSALDDYSLSERCGVCTGHSPTWDGHDRTCRGGAARRLRAALAAAPSETPREHVVRLSEDLAAGRAIHDPSGREVAPSETEEGRA